MPDDPTVDPNAVTPASQAAPSASPAAVIATRVYGKDVTFDLNADRARTEQVIRQGLSYDVAMAELKRKEEEFKALHPQVDQFEAFMAVVNDDPSKIAKFKALVSPEKTQVQRNDDVEPDDVPAPKANGGISPLEAQVAVLTQTVQNMVRSRDMEVSKAQEAAITAAIKTEIASDDVLKRNAGLAEALMSALVLSNKGADPSVVASIARSEIQKVERQAAGGYIGKKEEQADKFPPRLPSGVTTPQPTTPKVTAEDMRKRNHIPLVAEILRGHFQQ